MSTNPVLTTPELLSIVFGFSTKKSAATYTRVCRFWAAVGKPYVWQNLDSQKDLEALLRVLAPWDFFSPFELPSCLNWPHFLECSRLVHHLLVHDFLGTSKAVASALELIFKTHSAVDVFPNLRKLRCNVGEDLLQPSMNLLHPGVTEWYIEYLKYAPKLRISIPIQRLFGLVSLEVGSDIASDDLTVLSALSELPHLATIILHRYAVKHTILEVLSRFPSLQEIRTNNLPAYDDDCEGKHLLPAPFEKGSFPMLTTLTISECLYQISKMLDNEYFPFHIQNLIIETVKCSDDTSPMASTKIVAKLPKVTNFSLRDIEEHKSSPFASLEPFLSYNLTQLRVETYLALAYSTTEVDKLLHSLPMVETLYLDPGPILLSPSFGTFTFNHLPLFARHCPKLTYLGILLDASRPCDPLPDNTIPFTNLVELDLGWSFWSMSLSDGAVPLLARILPSHCQLTLDRPTRSPSFHSKLSEFLGELWRLRNVGNVSHIIGGLAVQK